LSNNVTLNVTSVNDVPVITSLVINSTSGENRPSDNLTATVSVQDADDTILKNVFDWRISGTSIAVLNMPFESNTSNSTFTKDFSTFGNDGSVINATFSTTGGFDGFGAYEFAGNDSFINITNSINDASGLNLTTPFTLEARIFPAEGNSGVNGEWPIILKGNGYFISYLAHSVSATLNRVRFGIYNTSGTFIFITSENSSVNRSEWTHVVGTFNGTFMRLYLNGELVNSTEFSENVFTPSDPVCIGCYAPGTGIEQFFNGTIDEPRIWNRALSAEQIQALFNNRTDVIVSNETNERENWAVTATPLDGEVEGQSVTSNTITIAVPSLINLSFINGVFFNGIFLNAPGIFNGTHRADSFKEGLRKHFKHIHCE